MIKNKKFFFNIFFGSLNNYIGLQIKNMVKEKPPFWVEFIAGWVGGVGQVLTAQPFDIIKIRLQTQSSENPIYKSTGDCFKKIMKNEGAYTFYKGTASPLIGVGTICAVQFMAYQESRKYLINVTRKIL